MNKLLIICGPTATGKTSLGIDLARKFKGEIVSADSRQVYKFLDIASGKDLPLDSKFKIPVLADRQNSELSIANEDLKIGYREKAGIPVWLVDVVEPDYQFNVGEYVKLAEKVISDIWSRGKLPIIVGGTGLYIKALFEPLQYVSIPPDESLRERLEKLDIGKLQKILRNIDKIRLEKMNKSDKANKRRLIRAIEISKAVEKKSFTRKQDFKRKRNNLLVGLITSKKQLYDRIDKRVEKRLKQGLIKEIKNLLNRGYSWDLPSFSALGYKLFRPYIEKEQILEQGEKKKLLETIMQRWKYQEHAYARRQITWFKKALRQANNYGRSAWFSIEKEDYKRRIEETVRIWYTLK